MVSEYDPFCSGDGESVTLVSVPLFVISCAAFVRLLRSQKMFETETSHSGTINIRHQPVELVPFPWEPSAQEYSENSSPPKDVGQNKPLSNLQEKQEGIPSGNGEEVLLPQKEKVHVGPRKVETSNEYQMNLQGQQEQLDFLAGMTFAGGGLRQPHCPCCQ
mmetsp:Transcript_16791/g.23346  ORF Transcript_16791/g.23346 Transcript_16791/m.23346 type:complete len:161 (+) Transcript_16791:189-671(+)